MKPIPNKHRGRCKVKEKGKEMKPKTTNEPIYPNMFKVKKSVWNFWSVEAQKMFNHIYSTCRSKDELICPDVLMDKKHYDAIIWNVAWMCANSIDGYETKEAKS